MNKEELNKIEKCFKYRDYETCIFLLSYFAVEDNEYSLILGIMLYFNKEYARAIYYLKQFNTYTSIYYKALAFKEMKRYKSAIEILNRIFNNTAKTDSLLILKNELELREEGMEFYYKLAGELYTLQGEVSRGIGKFETANRINSLYSVSNFLYGENRLELPVENKSENFVVKFFTYLNDQNYDKLKEYAKHIPGIGSYYISKAANENFIKNNMKSSLILFDLVRDKDPFFLNEMENYSNALFREKKANMLGLLAKELKDIAPNDHRTWITIANFYSLKDNQNLCF